MLPSLPELHSVLGCVAPELYADAAPALGSRRDMEGGARPTTRRRGSETQRAYAMNEFLRLRTCGGKACAYRIRSTRLWPDTTVMLLD